jgi:hypothetical protein
MFCSECGNQLNEGTAFCPKYSKEFFQCWKDICNENKEILKETWHYPSKYTFAVLKNGKSGIVGKVADKLGKEVYYEYYALDAVFYDEHDFVKPELLDTKPYRTDYWLKRIRVAFEHENNPHIAYQEISHLLTTNADMKVLVTYIGESDTGKYAENLSAITNGITTAGILLILGFQNESKDINWEGYILQDGKAEKIDE